MGELHRKEIPHVTKWFETVNSTKEFTGYFGKVWLCQKEMEPEFIVKENKQKNKQDKQKQEKPK